MTGIERLCEWAAYQKECVWCPPRPCPADKSGCESCMEDYLLGLADQIERETLPRPLFEDGEPVQFGDEVRHRDQGHVFKVDCIEVYKDGWFAVSQRNGVRDVARPGMKFEQPDTWERIAADVDSGEGYAGMDVAEVAADVLRRCKRLAGVE